MQNGNQAIKNILHHKLKTTSIFYNDKYQIVQPYTDEELQNLRKNQLKKLLNDNGINKSNTVGFNSLNKNKLIELALKKNIKRPLQ